MVQGPDGGTAAGVRGPAGGTAGAVRGPGGATAAGVVGPGGAGAAGVRGPAGVRGAGAVWGPNGAVIAGARGPYAGFVTGHLPDEAVHYAWGGYDYWHSGYTWYNPVWIGDDLQYAWSYPPVGYYYPALPPDYTTVPVGDNTYYYSEGVYYQEGQQNGQPGYVVAEAPEPDTAGHAANPFQILKATCDYLAGMQAMNVTVSTTSDEVLDSGEKVQMSTQRVIYVSRPDKVAAFVSGDNGEKRLVYDGKTIWLYDRKKGVYTEIQAPGTIDSALDTLANGYGIVLPMDDLLYKDSYERLIARVNAGQYMGSGKVGGTDCQHLAFTSDAVDWQVWVQTGDKPVPRKIAIDYKQYAGNPRYVAAIDWGDASRFSSETFEFVPPGGVRRIALAPVRAAATRPAADPAPSADAGKGAS